MYGVSGHSNHISVNQGVREMLTVYNKHFKQRKFRALELISTGFIRKYIGIFDAIFSSLSQYYSLNIFYIFRTCFYNLNLLANYKAMDKHKSQFVWYRKLFLIFSRYSYMNTLRIINY